MKSAELEARVKALEARSQATEDIEAIKKLQHAYGYYLEHWQTKQLLGLWSHGSDITFEANDTGLYKGWEQIKHCFSFEDHFTAYNGEEMAPPEYLHILMPNAGIVDLDPDGKTAKGRWYGFFLGAMRRGKGGKLVALIGCGIWENEYVKENGIWKIKKIFWNDIFCSPLDEGWVKTPYAANPPSKYRPAPVDNPQFLHYPSGHIMPYHYKNPVTSK